MTSREITLHNRRVLNDLEPGDMVEFPRGWFSHWGVYVGGENIIHLTGDENDGIDANLNSGSVFTISSKSFSKASVCEENFWDIVNGCKAEKNNGKDRALNPLSASQIVRKARAMIGKVGYNVLFNNCEHFVELCRYGKKWSEQADKALTGATIVGGAATVGLMVWRQEVNQINMLLPDSLYK